MKRGNVDMDHQRTEYKSILPVILLVSVFLLIFVLCLVSIQYISESELLYSILPFLILLFTLICGSMVGAQFPVANELYLDDPGKLTQSAGVLYAADLTGAWAGGILITLILIPIIGIIETGFILFSLKLGSMLIFRFSR